MELSSGIIILALAVLVVDFGVGVAFNVAVVGAILKVDAFDVAVDVIFLLMLLKLFTKFAFSR